MSNVRAFPQAIANERLQDAIYHRKLRDVRANIVDLLVVIDHELDGIRDGDGFWHGSDPVRHYLETVGVLCGEALAKEGK